MNLVICVIGMLVMLAIAYIGGFVAGARCGQELMLERWLNRKGEMSETEIVHECEDCVHFERGEDGHYGYCYAFSSPMEVEKAPWEERICDKWEEWKEACK
jgi:hypothetical protein